MTSILQSATFAVQKEIALHSPYSEMAKNCREMARNNFSLACAYRKEALTGIATLCLPNSTPTSLTFKERCVKITKAPLLMLRSALLYLPLTNRVTQLALSYLSPQKPIDFVKSSPLRPTNAELKIRYDRATLLQFVADYFNNKIEQKEEFDSSNLNSFVKLGFSSEECLIIFTQLSPKLSIDFINSPEFKEDEVKARYSENTRRKFIADHFKDKIKAKKELAKADLNLSEDESTIFISKLGFTREDCHNIFLNVLAQSPEIRCSINLKKEVNQHRKNNQG